MEEEASYDIKILQGILCGESGGRFGHSCVLLQSSFSGEQAMVSFQVAQ